MFFYLSKLLLFFIKPYSVLLLLLVLSFFVKQHEVAKAFKGRRCIAGFIVFNRCDIQ